MTELSREVKNRLAFELWHDYAQTFASVTGRFPKMAPVSGDFYSGRKWADYSETVTP